MALERRILIKVDSAKAERNVNSLDGKMRKLGGTADDNEQKFSKLKGAVVAVAAALQARKIQQYSDAFTSAQNQIRQTTKSTAELVTRTDQLFKVAQRSRVGISETAELYTNLVLSTENLNLSTEEQIRLTETISKSFSVSGKSAAESAGAIRQLGQAFASGALRGDEFNSIAEGAPEIMRALQRSLGKTQGELRDFAATGGITAEVLVKALGGAADVIDQKLAKSQKTFAQFATEAENNAIQFVGSSDLITNSVNVAGEALVGLSNNIDTLVSVGVAAAIVGFGRLSAGYLVSAGAAIKHATAVGGQTVAMRAGTIAANGLKRALSLLGGPLGVAITAATALVFFADTAETTKEKTERLTKETDQLADSFKALTRQQLDVQLSNATVKANELEKQFTALKKKIDSYNTSKLLGGSETGLIKLKEQAKNLENQLEQAIIKRDALFQAGIDSNLQGATDATSTKSVSVVGGSGSKELFRNTEKANTESLRAALAERLALKRAFNETVVSDTAKQSEILLANANFERAAELARLERDKAESAINFEERKANIRAQGEQRLLILNELNEQEKIQNSIFEEDKTQIERQYAEARMDIARQEAAEKINTIQGYANAALALNAVFGSKSEKANKRNRRIQVIADAAAGGIRAYAEHDFYTATGMAAIIAANAKKSIDAINSSSTASFSGGTSSQSQPVAQRQEPISQQLVVENRGLSEVLEELRSRDPQEPIPLEFALRIAAAQEDLRRISGE